MAHVERAGAVVGGRVDVRPGFQQHPDDLRRVAARAGGHRRVQRGPPGGGVAPVRRRRPRRAGGAPVPAGHRPLRSAARRCRRRRRAPGAASRCARHPRRRPRTAGRRRCAVAGVGAVVEVVLELVDVPEVGRARGVDLGAQLAAGAGRVPGASCRAACSGVRLNSVRAVRSAPASTSTRTIVRLPVGDGEVQRCPAALPVPLDGAGQQAGGGLDGGADGVDVAGGDEPAEALDGHACGHAWTPGLRSQGRWVGQRRQTMSRRTARNVPRIAATRP